MTTVPFASSADIQKSTDRIVPHLRAGGLIAYPTETVYGFGGLVADDAVAALATLKTRDPAKPFLLLIQQASDIPELVWTPSARRLAERFWPGALTLALRVQSDFPSRILSSEGAVAVRATPHAGLRTLLARLGEPITSSSANLPGAAPATNADEVAAVLTELGRSDVMVLDGGQLPPSASSTLVDCLHEPPRLLRAGVITTEALTQVVELEIDD
jgi:L-threonylcarbamoyladenylate synthase